MNLANVIRTRIGDEEVPGLVHSQAGRTSKARFERRAAVSVGSPMPCASESTNVARTIDPENASSQ